VQLAGELEERLGQPVSPVAVYDHPTIDALARHFAGPNVAAAVAAGFDDAANSEIAVVGIGCRFPGADGPVAFWKLLRRGDDAISEVPSDRWDVDRYYSIDPSVPGKMTTRFGGFLQNVDRFDRSFFGISPREAERMDPQQRLLLETTWEALEDAGHDAEQLAGSPVGVFVGISANDYGRLQIGNPADLDAYVGTGNALSIAANRLSYAFDFRGPSLAVDTACSSSLVAIHLAVQSLRRGESRLAVAAGVNLILTPDLTINFSRANMMAPDGRCKTFDASADGYVRSEGVGVVILKPLAQALADGDRIYAVVRGSAINQDGRSNGLTAPNRQSQEAVIRAACRNAGVAPADIDAVEAHGTGTALGDPIEALALGHVLAEGRDADRPAWIGSVKTNIGHLEAAAGVAGFIKMALALHHGELPASLHFNQPNPHIPFGELPLRVATEWQSLYERVRPANVGVSSFGFGGTNAHVVLQAVEPRLTRSIRDGQSHLIPISARTAEALEAQVRRWLEFTDETTPPLADLAFSAARRRTHFDHRLAIVASDSASLRDQLQAFSNREPRAGSASGQKTLRELRVAFVFSGQSAQWWGMGRDLLDREPVFRAAIDRCDEVFRPLAGWSLVDLLRQENDPAKLDDTKLVQPVIFALQVGIAALWRHWGVEPSAVTGHSLGEIAAAHVAGALRLDDAVRIVWHRARLQHQMQGRGKMAAVGLSVTESRSAINGLHDHIAVAAINGPESTVWSGDAGALERALQGLRKRQVFHRVLRGQVAFHSPQMESLRAPLQSSLKDVRPQASQIPFVSTVSGRTEPGEALTAEYWARNLREPVQFAAAVETLLVSDIDLFVEVGPHPVLAEPIRQIADASGRKAISVPSLRRNEDGRTTLLAGLGALYVQGVSFDWQRVTQDGSLVALPTYAWQRERCWFEVAPAARLDSQSTQVAAKPQPPAIARPYDPWLAQPIWEALESPVSGGSLAGTWLLVGPDRMASERIAAVMRGQGATVIAATLSTSADGGDQSTTIDPRQPDQWRRLVRESAPSGGNFRGVVYWNSVAPANEGLSLEQLTAAQDCGSIGALHLVQALVQNGAATRLWIVTRGAQAVRAGESAAVAAAPIWGFGRVVAREHPELRTTLIDLDPSPRPDEFGSVARLFGAEFEDDQWARRDGRFFAARLAPIARALPATEPVIHADATYLLTGGFGGLGLAAAKWLVARGARHLVLTGRRGATPESEPILAALRAEGAQIVVAQADVSDATQLDGVLAEIDYALPPLRGVMHLACVLDDSIALHLNRSRMWSVLAPKLNGAWNLHVRTAGRQLDFFVLFSSMASMIGSPGQSNYAAANAFLDALAEHRRARQLPATSINWGPWAEVGMAARDGVAARLAATGMTAIEPELGLEILGRAIESGRARLGVLPVEPAAWQRFAPNGEAPPYLAPMIRAASGAARSAAPNAIASALDRSALLAAPTSDWQPILENQLRDQAARVLKMAPASLDVEQSLSHLGIDSLMAIELKNRIEADLGIAIPMVKFLEGPSVRDLSAFLAEQLIPVLAPKANKERRAVGVNGHTPANGRHEANGDAPPAGLDVDAGQLLARLDTLSDAEVDSLLNEICNAEKGD
jgi:acyl transferase domain-containing protein/acyl carrier protein